MHTLGALPSHTHALLSHTHAYHEALPSHTTHAHHEALLSHTHAHHLTHAHREALASSASVFNRCTTTALVCQSPFRVSSFSIFSVFNVATETLVLGSQVLQHRGTTAPPPSTSKCSVGSAALGGRCGYDDSLSLAGAMFWFEIPFSTVPTQRQPIKHKASRVAYDVLVVDDSMALRHTMKLLLEQSGCTVSTAAGGDAALVQIQQRHDNQQAMFSVVLCDVQMAPHMGGYAMTSTLREWESGRKQPTARNQPVILMSGDASEAAAQKGYANGANAFLQKPVEFDELLRVISDVVIPASSIDSKPAMTAGQLLKEPQMVLQPSVIVPAIEFCNALQLVYGPDVQNLLSSMIVEIREGLAGLQIKKAAEDAHKLKGLFGALYLKDAFDKCALIHRLCQLDGNNEQIELHTQNLVCLFDKSMTGEILPEKQRFFAPKRPEYNKV